MSFKLSSSDSTFNSRVGALFDSLEDASKDSLPESYISSHTDHKNDSEDNLRFKKPINYSPIRKANLKFTPKDHSDLKSNKRKYTPDFENNPQKWTFYSLEDTDCQGDGQNRAIASQLLSSLKETNELPYEQSVGSSKNDKIEFKKPTKTITTTTTTTGIRTKLPLRKSEKNFVMPTFEFGKKKIKKNENPQSTSSKKEKKKEVCLSYLEEEATDDAE